VVVCVLVVCVLVVRVLVVRVLVVCVLVVCYGCVCSRVHAFTHLNFFLTPVINNHLPLPPLLDYSHHLLLLVVHHVNGLRILSLLLQNNAISSAVTSCLSLLFQLGETPGLAGGRRGDGG